MTEEKLVSLTIDGVSVQVPPGTLVVDAGKQAGISIPVFCYHPKMEPVGMCRVCLVEIGRPEIDRETGQVMLEEDGSPKIQFWGNLETACTTVVSEGMVVLGMTEKAKAGREDILELLLTSHPLDCPICDKGGECPLQNLTMDYGPGESRFLFDEKLRQQKNVPLGELIWLDRERCIQCGRCIRFQDEIVGDPVIDFYHRGRSTEIVTFSEPGFDSYWSGNTTDICPVGALTTEDFRFGARPWELTSSASICNHCPVGCNLTLHTRREAGSGGRLVVKRVLPRQNESVNEIWVCDKGRFGHHFAAQGSERLQEPLIRKDGELQATTWEEALELVAERFKVAGDGLFTLAGGRLSNEDLFNLRELSASLGGKQALYSFMGGGEFTSQLGLPPGSNLGDLGDGDAILVVGSDLEEEAPLWWLRVKQAVDRGAQLIVLNPSITKLDRAATYVLHHPFGMAAAAVMVLAGETGNLPESAQELTSNQVLMDASKAFTDARNTVIFYGSHTMSLAETRQLAQACARLLHETGRIGKMNNGLVGVWPRANDQGAVEIGWAPSHDLGAALNDSSALYIVAADPVGDDPAYQAAFGSDKFVVVQELFPTLTARLADVVLPAQSWTEREGSYTTGERRVQRFYPALNPSTALPERSESPGTSRSPLLTRTKSLTGPQADYVIPALIAQRINKDLPYLSAASVMAQLAKLNPVFENLDYQKLAQFKEQWPIMGRGDSFYAGTATENSQGTGVKLPLTQAGTAPTWPRVPDFKLPKLGLIAFPVARLYDQGVTIMASSLLHDRIGEPYVVLNAADADRLNIKDGALVRLLYGDQGGVVIAPARLDEHLPERVVLVPLSFGIPISSPMPVEVRLAERARV